MASVLEQLEAMRGVGENWDGYHAAAPQPNIIDAAVAFWRELRGREEMPEPYVTPNRVGGVLFFWEFGPHQLEVELLSPEQASFVYLDRDTDEAATGTLSLRRSGARPPLAFNAILSAMPAAVS